MVPFRTRKDGGGNFRRCYTFQVWYSICIIYCIILYYSVYWYFHFTSRLRFWCPYYGKKDGNLRSRNTSQIVINLYTYLSYITFIIIFRITNIHTDLLYILEFFHYKVSDFSGQKKKLLHIRDLSVCKNLFIINLFLNVNKSCKIINYNWQVVVF